MTSLLIEVLEARIAPAVFTVTSLSDLDRPGTLRHEIAEANAHANSANPGGAADSIVFARGLAGTIYLRSDLPAITDAVNLTGPGYTRLSLDGGAAHRILDLEDAGDVAISGLTFKNGRATEGGAILIHDAAGTVTLSGVVITRSVARSVAIPEGGASDPAQGGGIFIDAGHLRLTGSVITGNYAIGASATDAFGGGLYVGASADASLTGSAVAGNFALGGTGLSGARVTNGANGTAGAPGDDGGDGEEGVNGNSADSGGSAHGGGIYSEGALVIASSRITGNMALGGNGGLGSAGGNGGTGGPGGAAFTMDDETSPSGSPGHSGTGGDGGDGGNGGDATGGGIELHSTVSMDASLVIGNVAKAGNAGQAGLGGRAGLPRDGTYVTPGHSGTAGLAGDAAGGGMAALGTASSGANDPTVVTITKTLLSANRAVGGTGLSGLPGIPGAFGASSSDSDGLDGSDGERGSDAISGGSARGGAIFSGVKLSIAASTLSANQVIGGAGGLGGAGGAGGNGGNGAPAQRLDDGTVSDPGFGGLGGAGGIGGDGGNGGDAAGGGLYGVSTVTVTNSSLFSNLVVGGVGSRAGATGTHGAVGTGTPPDQTGTGGDDTPATNGTAGISSGGGLAVLADLHLVQSTIALNRAGHGGGIALFHGVSEIDNSTIAVNLAQSGGGVYIEPASDGSVTAISTLIANNAATSGKDVLGAMTASYSLIRSTDGITRVPSASDHNLIGVDPKLRVLVNYGTGAAVYITLPGSPILGAGSNPDDLLKDQRGAVRAKGTIDIGAVEMG